MQFYPAENGSRYSNGPFILQPNLNGTTAHVRPINVGPGRECHLRAAYLNRVELSSFIPRGPLAPSFPSRLSSSSPLHAVTRDRPAGMDAAAAAAVAAGGGGGGGGGGSVAARSSPAAVQATNDDAAASKL